MVSREEGIALSKELGCLFLECSAKTRENVEQCFEELALKVILDAFNFVVSDIQDIRQSLWTIHLLSNQAL